jgi:hypothetical protein
MPRAEIFAWIGFLLLIVGSLIGMAFERIQKRSRYQRNYIHTRPVADARSSINRFRREMGETV